MTVLQNQTFDDRDTDHLRYQGFWFLTGSWNASSVGESGTLSSSSDPNCNVTFTFPTPANAFYYYGIPRCCGGFYGICIDCDPNQPNFLPIDAVNTTDNGKNPPVVLFSMTFDKPGIHEIIIRNQVDPRFPSSQITIDRIDLQVVDTTVAETSSAAPTVTDTTSQTPTISPTTAPQTAASSTTPIAPIVGGAIGGFAVLAFFSFLLWFCLWRRRRRNDVAPQTFDSDPRNPAFQPPSTFLPGSDMVQDTSEVSIPPSVMPYGYSGKRQRHMPNQPSTSEDLSTIQRSLSIPSTSTSRLLSPPRVPRRETDAGRVPDEYDEEEEEPTLPPEYDQVFNRASRNMQAGGQSTSSRGRPLPSISSSSATPAGDGEPEDFPERRRDSTRKPQRF